MSDWRYSVVSIVGGYCVLLVGHSCSTPPDCGSLPLLPRPPLMPRKCSGTKIPTVLRTECMRCMSSVRTEPGLDNDLARFIGSSI